MSDGVRVDRSKSFMVAACAAGLISASTFLSVVLSFAFLVPLQIAFGRLGKQGGMLATGISAAALVVFQGWRLLTGSPAQLSLELSLAMLYPLLLVGAMLFLNADTFKRLAPAVRTLAVSLAISVLLAPLVGSLLGDVELRQALTESVASLVKNLTSATVGAVGAAASYDSAVLTANLDPTEMVATTLSIFSSCYAALIYVLIGGSWWLGNRLSGEGSNGRREAPALREIHLPDVLVWPFLASLALLLAAGAAKAGPAATAVAWNLSLVFALAYAAQGTGIVAHYLEHWKVPKPFRIAFVIAIALSATTSPIGLGLVAILPVLGVTELWIPYRNPKGVGA
jgi:hypothetical protein